MTQVVKDVVTWLKQWFYTETEVDTLLGAKVSTAQGSGNASKNVVTDSGGDIGLENKVSCGTGLSFDSSIANKINHSNSVTALTTASAKKIKHDAQGHITETSALYGSDIAVSSSDSTKIDTALSNKANSNHGHNANQIIDEYSNNYGNIGITTSWADQREINGAINTTIGNLQSIKAIEITSDKGTASASTMGKLYIVSENSKVNVYYTERTGTSPNYTYTWKKMDTDILDEYTVSWSDIQNKPSNTSDFINDGSDGTDSYVEFGDLKTVATTGSYTDLSDKPTIPDVSTKSDKTATIGTTITLVDAGETNEGCIIFNTIS